MSQPSGLRADRLCGACLGVGRLTGTVGPLAQAAQKRLEVRRTRGGPVATLSAPKEQALGVAGRGWAPWLALRGAAPRRPQRRQRAQGGGHPRPGSTARAAAGSPKCARWWVARSGVVRPLAAWPGASGSAAGTAARKISSQRGSQRRGDPREEPRPARRGRDVDSRGWVKTNPAATAGIHQPTSKNPCARTSVLLLRNFYKVLWLLIVAYPLWTAGKLASSPDGR